MKKPGHIIVSAIEHHAVLEPARQLEREGWAVTMLPVSADGLVSAEAVGKALRKDTVLVSVMYANNEIGSVQPIADIGREILKWRKAHHTPFPYIHTDACQAAAYLDLGVDRLHLDLLTLNGSKMCGPKGSGMLYARRGVLLAPILFGGGQEAGRRSGTENTAAIIGFARALGIAEQEKMRETKRIARLRDALWDGLKSAVPDIILNGPIPDDHRLPNNLHISIPRIEGEALVFYLDAEGIQCASGSACASASGETSHVLRACGADDAAARSSIRITLGRQTTAADIAYAIRRIPVVIDRLRRI
jgi:cysteine desulfurase